MHFSQTETKFLEALRAAIRGQSVQWDETMPPEAWSGLMDLAHKHHVLPLIYEAVYRCPAAGDQAVLGLYKYHTMNMVTMQTMRTSEFLGLYRQMKEAGLHPLVVKGIVCRGLYPQGDFRPSGDDDLYVPVAEFDAFRRLLLDNGLTTTAPEDSDAYEISFVRPGSTLHIELHRYLFPPESGAYGVLQDFFRDAFETSEEYPAGFGTNVASLNPQAHLLYLILHAYKHFVHAGFGLRQVCDIGLWAEKYQARIDWENLRAQCREAHALGFAASVFQIARDYLDIPLDIPEDWTGGVPCEPMLKDLLVGGIYGSADRSRLHSSTATVEAVAAHRENRRSRNHAALFPSLDTMKNKYPMLRKHPYLLPAAWCMRIASYGRELIVTKNGSGAADTLRIANERKELLKLYDII